VREITNIPRPRDRDELLDGPLWWDQMAPISGCDREGDTYKYNCCKSNVSEIIWE
jgi:hypothetical protein